MNVLSLFDGISCGRIALYRAGIDVDNYYASEIDSNAITISHLNYPDIIQLGDIFNLDIKYLKTLNIDLIMGGSPCTFWSIARNKKSREIEPKGMGWNFFSKFVEILNELKPKYFLYENNASISPVIKESISNALGVEYQIINSAVVSAQDRKRCYWTNIPYSKCILNKNIYLKDILEKERKDWRPIGNWLFTGNCHRKLEDLKTINSLKSFTLTTSKTHPQNYICNEERTLYSNLTINEYEKLQTLPINYTMGVKESARYKAVGNGWTVDIIVEILKGIKRNEKKN